MLPIDERGLSRPLLPAGMDLWKRGLLSARRLLLVRRVPAREFLLRRAGLLSQWKAMSDRTRHIGVRVLLQLMPLARETEMRRHTGWEVK
jgi:hypothetical protein